MQTANLYLFCCGVNVLLLLQYANAYSEPCQSFKMEHFAKIVNG